MSGFYDFENLPNFNVNNPANLITANLQLIKSSIHFPPAVAIYDSPSTGTYKANDLLNGYIIRRGLLGTSITDEFDTASNIIEALRIRCKSIINTTSFPNGTSFKCILYNDVSNANVDNSNYGLYFYSSPDLTVRVGGSAAPQITGGATAVLEITVNDQASLGTGHQDEVFICISRCSTRVSID